jgi:hypothetical protein
MAFQKGMPKPANSGRKKGSLNKKRLKKVAEALAEAGLEPASEIVKEIALMDEPKDRAKAWVELLAYCEAKPKAVEIDPNEDSLNPEDFADVSTEDLLKLVKGSSECS